MTNDNQHTSTPADTRPVAVYTRASGRKLTDKLQSLRYQVDGMFGTATPVVEFHDPGTSAQHPQRTSMVNRAADGEFRAVVVNTRWDLEAAGGGLVFRSLCALVVSGPLHCVVTAGRSYTATSLDVGHAISQWFPDADTDEEVLDAIITLASSCEPGRMHQAIDTVIDAVATDDLVRFYAAGTRTGEDEAPEAP